MTFYRALRILRIGAAVLSLMGLLTVLEADGAQAASKAEQAARRDAIRRLASAPLPPHTRTVSRFPRALGLNESPITPATPNLVDRHSLFVTALGPGRAFNWFKTNPPPRSGSGLLASSGSDHSPWVLGFSWGNSQLVEERALYVTIADRPQGGAAIRIDSQATWGDAGSFASWENRHLNGKDV
jgi:hypothetical protein